MTFHRIFQEIFDSGEKQRVDRGYDFVGVLQWFAERVDRIILLFDANKLDISDEFRRSIQALDGYQDKVRIVLNKADQIDRQELMRCYGALMWSITQVLNEAECPRVYVGSFWDQHLKHDLYRRLFERELQGNQVPLLCLWHFNVILRTYNRSY